METDTSLSPSFK